MKNGICISKEVKMKLETIKLSIVYYTIAICIDVSFLLLIHLYRSVSIAINRYFDVMLQP